MSSSEQNITDLEQKLQVLQDEVGMLRKKNSDLNVRLEAYSLINTGQISLINKLIDKVPFGMVLLNDDNIITHANAAAGKVFSTVASKMKGQHSNKYFQSYDSNIENSEDEVTLQKINCNDEDKFVIHSAFVSDEGSDKVIVETFIDITEIKKAEQELININKTKDEFLGMISHELRTPLNVIQGYSSLLKDELKSTENIDVVLYVENITRSGEMLLHTVDNLLELSNLTAGKVHVDNIPIDMDMIIMQLEYRLDVALKMNNNNLHFNVEKIKPFVQDLALLMKSLYELMVNANKFTENGDITLAVSLIKKDMSDWLSFKITDTGCGMAGESMKKIFDAFHQADSSLTRRHEGLGLGLSLVEKMLKIINGYVEVDSTLGKGTTFTIYIPYEPV